MYNPPQNARSPKHWQLANWNIHKKTRSHRAPALVTFGRAAHPQISSFEGRQPHELQIPFFFFSVTGGKVTPPVLPYFSRMQISG